MLKLIAVGCGVAALYAFLSRIGHGPGPVVMTAAASYVGALMLVLVHEG